MSSPKHAFFHHILLAYTSLLRITTSPPPPKEPSPTDSKRVSLASGSEDAEHEHEHEASETTPLLPPRSMPASHPHLPLANGVNGHTPTENGVEGGSGPGAKGGKKEKLGLIVRYGAKEIGKDAIRALPAVILGTLLNILDGVSCQCSPVSLE